MFGISIKNTYRDNRHRLKGKKLKQLLALVMMLPDDNDNRTRIVKWVAKEYYKKYGNTVITDRWYRKFRQKARNIWKSKLLDRKHKGKDSVFVGGTFLLNASD